MSIIAAALSSLSGASARFAQSLPERLQKLGMNDVLVMQLASFIIWVGTIVFGFLCLYFTLVWFSDTKDILTMNLSFNALVGFVLFAPLAAMCGAVTVGLTGLGTKFRNFLNSRRGK